jgi:general secretion pathway protein J
MLELLVAIFVLAMLAVLIYGAFDSMSRGEKTEAMRIDRSRQGREAIQRMVKELSAAFLSMHAPPLPSQVTRVTAFIGQSGGDRDRVDFASFSHRRFEKDAKESDQCEVGYFVSSDPDVSDKYDLVRREQTPIDFDPKKGGVVNVLVENIESFDLRYFDPYTGLWIEQWDSTQVTGQPGRLPLEVAIRLVVKGLGTNPPYVFSTKVMLPIQQPLSFGISR